MERIVAAWYTVGDVETVDPVQVKLATARARLPGRPRRAIARHLAAGVAPGRDLPHAVGLP